MFKTFYVNSVEDLLTALGKRFGLNADSVEYAKMAEFITDKTDPRTGVIGGAINLVWKKVRVTIDPSEIYADGVFQCSGYTVSGSAERDSLFDAYSVTGFDNLLYSLAERFKIKPSDDNMLQIKEYLKSLIPAGQSDLTSPCGLYIKKYPIYINALAQYNEVLEMWATEYIVTCGDKRADLPVFNIS